MGIFTRFRDIISSNVNSMLDKAENPEKLIKLMIQEMEDTLVEIKASCAGTMASRARVLRALDEAKSRLGNWQTKAQLAVDKGREDLAREALVEKRNFREQVEALDKEAEQLSEIINQYQSDIEQLEEKLANTRNKHRVLVQRHIHAQKRRQAQTNIRQVDNSDAFVRFDQFESRIDRLEAEADLINVPRKPTLEDQFKRLETDEEIEKELQSLKSKGSGKPPEIGVK
jgi:phage shock protein A